ncbi:hypothetical protein GCM10007972_22870 [Iodidimonas muriae]|uniref:Uncharacterized protein n=1 Tax=Iodidimonas muriae TaxID=261467 RepID=A0ABQ2LFD8_9PROT|nr:hypothetical protein JCM17843_20900 [Kordiimonadales bacterium JCM 17843]GGO15067.1 hypothetical protein GCM10007972_22870 [Iodidimonas muriae]
MCLLEELSWGGHFAVWQASHRGAFCLQAFFLHLTLSKIITSVHLMGPDSGCVTWGGEIRDGSGLV